MNEGRPSHSLAARSWRERLGQVLLGEPQDREQLVEFLRNASDRRLLDPETLSMIEGALVVGEMQVRDIMVPRSQMVVVERDNPPEETLEVITQSAHSRFPVIGESRDDIVGILLAKDMLLYCQQREARSFNIRDILRPAVFIPESKRLNVLLREFRASRNHMAIVVDEYGGTAGLVTIEDVLEQIVGEIEDEHDIAEDAFIFHRGDDNYTIKALTPIEDFNEYFGTDFSDEEFDTIGGLVLNGFGRVPERGEAISISDFEFKVLRADSRRIHLLELYLLSKADGIESSAVKVGG
ncbi:CBS domain containing protein [Nitrosococcus halophilus Nc 4]|uniref:Magnesium and cobalt efflux protein CorC n=1 Tax=Nitrosococcus halophilus (strain Nc4) TaxID=472759 RepID=D5C3K3_NITHN|nr:transporter associated domain-containing protein [Nitrosococcus halophilus]ADE16910.1 CBS domain containing protein [Nitrosococcus halophilus Nc 4]